MNHRFHIIVSLLLAQLLVAPRASGQSEGWSGIAEASASIFQGNTDQRALFTRTELGRADSTIQARGALSFGYADAAHDSLPREVTKRTWLGSIGVDYRPYAYFSPFVFLNYEASYEKRVLDRVGVGAGGKFVLFRSPVTEGNLSLAMLVERLRPTALSPESTVESAARWSGRARFRYTFDDRLKLSHTTFFQPTVGDLDAYTVNSTSELGYALRQSTSLTLSYLSTYDSEARARGALSNNDAQLLFGVKTEF